VVNPVKIILFGSWAYGKHEKGSDLDISIVMDNDIKSRHEIESKIYGALRGILIPKDVVVATLHDIEEWRDVPQAFITKIFRKGKLLYER
jgi:predicted nucleotidyltransferase